MERVLTKNSYTYQYKTEALRKSISQWFAERNNIVLPPDRLQFTAGVMTGIAAAIDAELGGLDKFKESFSNAAIGWSTFFASGPWVAMSP